MTKLIDRALARIGAALVSFFVLAPYAHSQGVVSPFSGPVHASMGGASTAAPLDALGANYWNPAAISALWPSEVSLGTQLAYPEIYASSAIRGIGGTTRSDSGLVMIPGFALVYHPEEIPGLTLGMGSYASGAGVNYRGDPSNPIFSPTGPFGNFVLGPSFANMAIFQSVTNVSYQVTDKLAVGVGAVLDYALVSFDPAFFAPADDANGDGIRTFPAATHSRPFWGAGFKAGVYYRVTPSVDIGFGYTSPQWLETWYFNARDELGNPRQLRLRATLPAIYSWGVGFHGIERLTLATDLRYIDYQNTELFGVSVPNGGLGWQSVFAVAVGGQYEVTDRLSVRAGYTFNTNPVLSFDTLFNVQAPAITMHTISAGFSLRVWENIISTLAYSYAFPNSISGPLVQLTGTGTTITTSAHSLLFGVTIRLGGSCKCCAPCPPASGDAPACAAADASAGTGLRFNPGAN